MRRLGVNSSVVQNILQAAVAQPGDALFGGEEALALQLIISGVVSNFLKGIPIKVIR